MISKQSTIKHALYFVLYALSFFLFILIYFLIVLTFDVDSHFLVGFYLRFNMCSVLERGRRRPRR